MPLRIRTGITFEADLHIDSPGAMTTAVNFHDPFDNVVPFLQVDSASKQISWKLSLTTFAGDIPTPLQPLPDQTHLIGFAITDEAIASKLAAKLFPGDQRIPIRLDAHDPIPGNAAAWESLDALVIDQSTFASFDEQRLSVLVAGGVAVVVRAPQAPMANWPWESLAIEGQDDRWWVLRYTASGPRTAGFTQAAQIYRPVQSWSPGWPPEFRKRIFAMAVVYSVLVIALALWRPPKTSLWMLGLFIVTLSGLRFFWKFQTPLTQRNGQVVVLDRNMAQIDDWLYQTSFRRMEATVYWGEYTKPIYSSLQHLADARPLLLCRPNGDPAYIIHSVGNGMRTALLLRRVGPHGPVTPPTNPIKSPMLEMVKSIYVVKGDQLAGELPSTPLLGTPYSGVDLWPAVVIERQHSTDRISKD